MRNEGISRRSFLGAVGGATALALGSGVLTPSEVYADYKGDGGRIEKIGKYICQGCAYMHFLCDTVRDNPNFGGLQKQPGITGLGKMLGDLASNGLIVQGFGNVKYHPDQVINYAFLGLNLPKGLSLFPVVNGQKMATHVTSGQDWQRVIWPLTASVGAHKLDIKCVLPNDPNNVLDLRMPLRFLVEK